MSDTYMHGYKFQIYPNDEQKEFINGLVQLYRKAYNWGIAKEEEQYEKKKNGETSHGFLTYYELNSLFREYRNLPENEWMVKYPFATPSLALRDVVQAYKNFFAHRAGYPKFKSKKTASKMFKTRSDRFYIDGDQVRIEGLSCKRIGCGTIVDTIDLNHEFDFSRTDKIKYRMPCVSIDNLGKYWVAFSVEEPIEKLDKPTTEPIGIDLGIRKTMVLSTGEEFIRPNDKLKILDKRLRRAQHHRSRDISRRMDESIRTKTKYEDLPVSNRAKKRADKVRKLCKKITDIKTNYYHNTIKEIVKRNPEAIVVETLDVKKLQKSCKGFNNAHQIHHADFGRMRKIIKEKCKKYGVKLIEADPHFPSSQKCSKCGHIQEISSSTLTYTCKACGAKIDRDLNAAINLRDLALVS